MSQPAYNLRNIRKLLTAAFSDEELSKLCYETPEFRPVYEQFATGMSKDQKIQRLIEYCERKVMLGQLLEVIEEEAPEQYAQFAGSLIAGGKKPEPPSLSTSVNLSDEIKSLQDLISIKTRSLHHLQLQAAKYGISVPVHIALEIEDLEKQIDELKQELNAHRQT